MTVSTPTTAGQILTSAYVNNNINSGLVYIKEQTIGTTVSSVTVSDAFSTTYDNYKIMISGGVGSGTSSLELKLGASATGYYSGLFYVPFGFSAASGASDNNAAAFTYAGYATTNFISFDLDVINPFLAKSTVFGPNTWVAGVGAGSATGAHTVASSFTAFTITPNAGTLTGGTIFIYGYRKA
jgi:hypothetical protein